MSIFFDLDGTLIDSRQRLYQLFQHLIPQSKLSFDEYWRLKRNKKNHEAILKEYFNIKNFEFKNFEKDWMNLVENETYLNFDQPFEKVTEYLFHLKDNGFSIYLTTARQYKKGVLFQFDKFGWTNLFDQILVTEQNSNKEDLIKPFVDLKKTNWIVGDTGKDIQIGKYLEINTVAVLTGFLSKEVLLSYHPDLILGKVIDFKPLITKITK